MIIEPLVQGAGGMRFHSPETLGALYDLAKEHDLLFIADEIATGFWRTGHRFACESAGIRPDLLCLGKALTGGTITMGATLAREEVFRAFLSDDWDAALMHGPTYMANPLACAAANASLDLFDREPRETQVRAIEEGLHTGLEACRTLPGVVDVRVRGAIGVVQIEPGVDVYALRPRFVEQGVWIRPFKDIVYLMPPLVIGTEDLDTLTRSVRVVLAHRADTITSGSEDRSEIVALDHSRECVVRAGRRFSNLGASASLRGEGTLASHVAPGKQTKSKNPGGFDAPTSEGADHASSVSESSSIAIAGTGAIRNLTQCAQVVERGQNPPPARFGGVEIPPDVYEFILRRGIERHLESGIEAAIRHFANRSSLRVYLDHDPDTLEDYVVIEVNSSGDLESDIRTHINYSDEWSSSVEWPASRMILLDLNPFVPGTNL